MPDLDHITPLSVKSNKLSFQNSIDVIYFPLIFSDLSIMNLLSTELAGKRDYSEQHNSLTSNLLFADLCICMGEYFSGIKREFKFVHYCIRQEVEISG